MLAFTTRKCTFSKPRSLTSYKSSEWVVKATEHIHVIAKCIFPQPISSPA